LKIVSVNTIHRRRQSLSEMYLDLTVHLFLKHIDQTSAKQVVTNSISVILFYIYCHILNGTMNYRI